MGLSKIILVTWHSIGHLLNISEVVDWNVTATSFVQLACKCPTFNDNWRKEWCYEICSIQIIACSISNNNFKNTIDHLKFVVYPLSNVTIYFAASGRP